MSNVFKLAEQFEKLSRFPSKDISEDKVSRLISKSNKELYALKELMVWAIDSDLTDKGDAFINIAKLLLSLKDNIETLERIAITCRKDELDAEKIQHAVNLED